MGDAGYWQPTPAEVPTIEIGTVLIFERGETRTCSHRLRLRVEVVRDDLNRYYVDAVWLEGMSLASDGTPNGRTQVLVETAAIPEAICRGARGPVLR